MKSPFTKRDPAAVPPAGTPAIGAPQPDKQPVVEHRLDRLLVTAVVTVYQDGVPVTEQRTQPILMFRASAPDIWAALEQALQQPQV